MAEERRRIARELHDLAGHTLAAVMLHVTGARHVLRRDLDEAERALVDAETVGRASLDQIRATVAALRTDERGTDPALAGSADLVALVEEYRRAGLADRRRHRAGRRSTSTAPTGTALHRIAREALANVAHHAPGNAVVARPSSATRRGLRLSVVDHGQPPRPPADRPRPLRDHRDARARPRARRASSTPDRPPTGGGSRRTCRHCRSAPHVEVPS